MINDQSVEHGINTPYMTKPQLDSNETPMMVGIMKNSYINQPTRTTGYTSAIGGGTATQLDMHTGIPGLGPNSTSFNIDKTGVSRSVTPTAASIPPPNHKDANILNYPYAFDQETKAEVDF